MDPNHAGLIRQLEQRKKDPRLVLRVNVVIQTENQLARWLAEDGSQNRTRRLFRRLFGRVKELWMPDMGLGPITGDFQVLSEEEYDDMLMMEAEEEEMEANMVEISDESSDEEGGMGAGVDGEGEAEMLLVMEGVNQPGMGRSG